MCHTWLTADDYKKIALSTLIPGTIGLVGSAVLLQDKSHMEWFKRCAKPAWGDFEINTYMAVDTAVTLPLGAASYLVYKHGGGFGDGETKMALYVYGATLGMMLVTIPAVLKRKLCLLHASSTATAVLATTTSYLFYKIHRRAGLIMVPFAAWMWFYAALSGEMKNLDKKN